MKTKLDMLQVINVTLRKVYVTDMGRDVIW